MQKDVTVKINVLIEFIACKASKWGSDNFSRHAT
jgi:hypothetical protein